MYYLVQRKKKIEHNAGKKWLARFRRTQVSRINVVFFLELGKPWNCQLRSRRMTRELESTLACCY
ncbi:uncharacterized protein BJ212DRAFT_1392389 [Suillus subaureus]|uniref:Uncharacterized protein n=1 Tax=Suillus subaureus TaxID=48587 RepID=A0A9P7J6Q9_9AGAM|nr:uncharacterized protein BJ212DRAFT_1392389 [Suillus subaureus]KAG1805340.1 hypothetical protein BJ212DRAFT_1392389 [Suillus subaureus]